MPLDNCLKDAPFGQSVVSDWLGLVDRLVRTQRNDGYIDFEGANLLARAIRTRSIKYGLSLSNHEQAFLWCVMDETSSKEDDGIHPSDS